MTHQQKKNRRGWWQSVGQSVDAQWCTLRHGSHVGRGMAWDMDSGSTAVEESNMDVG